MTQEDKQLVFVDLCPRYGVICSIFRTDDIGVGWRNEKLTGYFKTPYSYEFYFGEDAISVDNVDRIKPYLRSPSSMTEEEIKTIEVISENKCPMYWKMALTDYIKNGHSSDHNGFSLHALHRIMDYLDAIYVDYRGLIPRGLAIEAPDGMYEMNK